MEQTTTISLAEYNKLKRENQLMSAGKIKVETKFEAINSLGIAHREEITFYTKDKLVKKLARKLQKVKDRAFAFETKCGAMEAEINSLRERKSKEAREILDNYDVMKFSLDAAESRNEVLEKRNRKLEKIVDNHLANSELSEQCYIDLANKHNSTIQEYKDLVDKISKLSCLQFRAWRKHYKENRGTMLSLSLRFPK